MNNSTLDVRFLGKQEYHSTWEYQQQLAGERLKCNISDTLLFVEHDPVFTIGKSGSESNIRGAFDGTHVNKIPVIRIDRGGDITFHGPGQLVGYPVLKLTDYYTDLHKYLRNLEEVIIQSLSEFAISAVRREGLTGVWVGSKKIASIGVKVTRWVTYHGFALNVKTDLNYFNMITPCGIDGCVTTSIKDLTKIEYRLEDVASIVESKFRRLFVPNNESVQVSLNQ